MCTRRGRTVTLHVYQKGEDCNTAKESPYVHVSKEALSFPNAHPIAQDGCSQLDLGVGRRQKRRIIRSEDALCASKDGATRMTRSAHGSRRGAQSSDKW